jgi:hypothetical protein
MVFTKFVFAAFSNHSQVDFIYLDFSNAFERVNHKILLKVLFHVGFGEPLLLWFMSFLSDRKQFVKVNGIKSWVIDVPSGVSLGGHLSSLLFSLFINGVKDVINESNCLLFADDLKLYITLLMIVLV